jgi:hypothetical protein
VAEHDGKNISQGTLATVTAASKIGGDITMLVAGNGLGDASKAAAAVAGVSKVMVADSEVSLHFCAQKIRFTCYRHSRVLLCLFFHRHLPTMLLSLWRTSSTVLLLSSAMSWPLAPTAPETGCPAPPPLPTAAL